MIEALRPPQQLAHHRRGALRHGARQHRRAAQQLGRQVDPIARFVLDHVAADVGQLHRDAQIHRAPIIHEFPAPHAGTLSRLDAGIIGKACLTLGAGRAKTTDQIDYAVGFDAFKKVGAAVQRGEPLLRIHARTPGNFEAVLPMVQQAITIA